MEVHKKVFKRINILLIAAIIATEICPIALALDGYNSVDTAGGTGTSTVLLSVDGDTASPSPSESDSPSPSESASPSPSESASPSPSESASPSPSPSPDTKIFSAFVPVSLPVHMDTAGTITVPTDAKIINGNADYNIAVKGIDVGLGSGWAAANYDDDFTKLADDTHTLGLKLRTNTLGSDSKFNITESDWVIGKDGSLPLNMKVKLPKQTKSSTNEELATLGFTMDWSELTASNPNTPDVEPTMTVSWDSSPLIPSSKKVATFNWTSPVEGDKIESVTSSDTGVADILDTTDMAFLSSADLESTPEYSGSLPVTIKAKKKGTSTITATLASGFSKSFSAVVSEVDNSKAATGTANKDLAAGDTVTPSDVNVTIVIKHPDGTTENVTVQPSSVTDLTLQDGDNNVSVVVNVNGVDVPTTINIHVKNPSSGVTQSVADATAAGYTFSSYSDGVAITAFTNKLQSADIIIPEQIGDFKVLKIGDKAFSGQTNIKNVSIPSTVTRIGKSAFSGCSNMNLKSSLTNVTYIDDYAFQSCKNMTCAVALGNLTYLGTEAFAASAISGVSISGVSKFGSTVFDTIKPMDYFKSPMIIKANTKSVDLSSGTLTDIGYNYNSNAVLESITLPSECSHLCKDCFKNCTNLKEVLNTDNIDTLGAGCFYNCTSLQSFSSKAASITLGDQVFEHCSSLSSLNLPPTSAIPAGAFAFCSSLTEIVISDGVTSIIPTAFSCCSSLKDFVSNSKEFKVEDSRFLVSVADNRLVGFARSGVTDIIIPSDIVTIAQVFYNADALKSVVIPSSVTTIEPGTFLACINADITVPDSVTTIGTNAFSSVKHVSYTGSATGSPWGAKAIN